MDSAVWGMLGGDLTPTAPCWYRAGRWRLALDSGALRHVAADGVEVLRGVDFVVRDADWGTLPVAVEAPAVATRGEALTLTWRARAGAALDWKAEVEIDGEQLRYAVEAVVLCPFDTNRTGLSVLHPLEGFSGAAVRATGPDGATRLVTIPHRISPGQPLRDFTALAWAVAGLRIRVDLDADQPFEMEDQRNWTDASFKTYYRPLGLPFPYRLEVGTAVRQTVTVTLDGRAVARPAARTVAPATARSTPARHLAWLPTDPAPDSDACRALAQAAPDALSAWIDLRDGAATAAPPKALDRVRAARVLSAALGVPLHLRLIAPDAVDPAAMLVDVAEAAGSVTSAMTLPAAFLQSHQPDGPWPGGLQCDDALAATRAAFPAVEVVEGMLTFFPEFNRHPPRSGGDAVTVSTAAIVHAADDISVMETLQALPAVFETAQAQAQGRPLDIGLAAIGLWHNPYGAAVAKNPAWTRRAIATNDPRARGLFGAAWLVGYLAHAAAAVVRSVGVGAVSGPLGLLPGQGDAAWRAVFPEAVVRPAFHAVAALGRLGPLSQATAPGAPGAVALLRGAGGCLVANTGSDAAPLPEGACAGLVLDTDSLPDALADPGWTARPAEPLPPGTRLPAYAIALLTMEN